MTATRRVPPRPAWPLPPLGLREKLLLSHLGLVLLAMALAALWMLQQMERFYLDQLQTNLVVESLLLAEPAADAVVSGAFDRLRATLAAVDRESAVLVWVFDADGRLVATTEADAARIGERPDLPGLAAALSGTPSATVVSSQDGPEVMYLVTPIVRDGQVRGAIRLAYDLVDVRAEVAGLREALLIGLAGAAAITAAVALLLAARLAAPARRLAHAARQVADGALGTRCAVQGSDEVAAAAQAFDEMAARLEAAQAARQELLATVAHDLHASTMALSMAVESLERGAADEPDLRAELLHGIGSHAQRLTRLADDLLQTARLEAGELRLQREPLAPASLLQRAAAEFAAEAAARRVTLALEIAAPQARVDADPARLGQALANLVENALRHAPPGSTVHLQTEARAGEVVLAVADEGPGLTDPAWLLATAPDQRADEAATAFEWRGRLGLGLSIVRGIVEAHGGRLEVASTPGAGARFALILPVLAVDDECARRPAAAFSQS